MQYILILVGIFFITSIKAMEVSSSNSLPLLQREHQIRLLIRYTDFILNYPLNDTSHEAHKLFSLLSHAPLKAFCQYMQPSLYKRAFRNQPVKAIIQCNRPVINLTLEQRTLLYSQIARASLQFSLFDISFHITQLAQAIDNNNRKMDNLPPYLSHLNEKEFATYLQQREKANYQRNHPLYFYYMLNIPHENLRTPRNLSPFFLAWKKVRTQFNRTRASTGNLTTDTAKLTAALVESKAAQYNRKTNKSPCTTPFTIDEKFRDSDHLPEYLLHLDTDEFQHYLKTRQDLLLNNRNRRKLSPFLLAAYMLTCSDENFVRWQQERKNQVQRKQSKKLEEYFKQNPDLTNELFEGHRKAAKPILKYL
jgi:hypothetical protein